MNKVKNKKAVSGLAFHELKSSRRMNFVILLSIVLTCVMFTALATIGGSLISGFQRETMRQVGGDRMAGLKYVQQADYEKVLADPKTKDVTYRIIVGRAENNELRNVSMELNCPGNDDAAKAMFSMPTTGRLPQEMNEIAVSSLALGELGIPCELGSTVPLKVVIDEEHFDYEFVLCGYWEGDPMAMAQEGFVSRAFADKYAPAPEESYYANPYGGYAGYWQVDFNFANSFNIEGKVDRLLHRLYTDIADVPGFGINWAYSMSTIDLGSMMAVAILLLVIFLAGYLIIYNIFFINISANVRKYGLLKTIGMTPKQIRRLVQIQTRVYGLIGIPVGLLLGLLIGKVLFRSVLNVLSLDQNMEYQLSMSMVVMICLFAAAFTYLTVMVSCDKPARMAGEVSPMEALRYNETSVKTKKDHKKTSKIHPFTMAKGNLARSKKKTCIVILSLALSLILLNTMVTVVSGLDMDKYVEYMMVGDFQVTKAHSVTSGICRITPEQVKVMEEADSIRECNLVYLEDGDLVLSEKGIEKAQWLYDNAVNAEKWEKELERSLETGKWNESEDFSLFLDIRNLAKGAAYIGKGVISAEVYGIDPEALELVNIDQGTLDPKKFATGNYALVNTQVIGLKKPYQDKDQFFEVGEKLTVCMQDGRSKEYEVMAIADLPYALTSGYYTSPYGHVIVPTTEYEALSDKRDALSATVYAKEGQYENARELLLSITERPNSSLILKSKDTYVNEFNGMVSTIHVVGGALAGVLALIGVLNYVNAMVTSIIARKKEFAMMQAVGMTGKQLRAMLIWEGVVYAAGTFVVSSALGSALSAELLKGFENITFFYTYHFTLLPILISIPFLVALAIVIPTVAYRFVAKESVVNRLHDNE